MDDKGEVLREQAQLLLKNLIHYRNGCINERDDIAEVVKALEEQAALSRHTAPETHEALVERGYGGGYEWYRNKWIGDHEEMTADLVRCFVPRPSTAPETDGEVVPIPRQLFEFLMGRGEIDGIGFGEMNAGLPGRFWWRALLRTCDRAALAAMKQTEAGRVL